MNQSRLLRIGARHEVVVGALGTLTGAALGGWLGGPLLAFAGAAVGAGLAGNLGQSAPNPEALRRKRRALEKRRARRSSAASEEPR